MLAQRSIPLALSFLVTVTAAASARVLARSARGLIDRSRVSESSLNQAVESSAQTMNGALISIIVPYTNFGPDEQQLFSTLSKLDRAVFEIIWVLNSPNDHRDAVRNHQDFGKSMTNVSWERRPGAGRARNHGIALASGSFLWFVDSDDAIEVSALTELINLIATNASDADVILVGARDVNLETGEERTPDWFLRSWLPEGPSRVSDYHPNLFQLTNPAPWNKLFSRSFVDQARMKFSSSRKINDLAFVYGCLARANHFVVSRNVVYEYRRNRSGSIQTGGYGLGAQFKALLTLGLSLVTAGNLGATMHSFLTLAVSTLGGRSVLLRRFALAGQGVRSASLSPAAHRDRHLVTKGRKSK